MFHKITCHKLNHSHPSTQPACLHCSALWPCLESVVQSANAKGGTNQWLRPISGQSSHQSNWHRFYSESTREERRRKTIHHV